MNRNCKRCGYTWEGRSKKRPKVCPRCKSPYWDKPYIRADKVKENRRTKNNPPVRTGLYDIAKQLRNEAEKGKKRGKKRR